MAHSRTQIPAGTHREQVCSKDLSVTETNGINLSSVIMKDLFDLVKMYTQWCRLLTGCIPRDGSVSGFHHWVNMEYRRVHLHRQDSDDVTSGLMGTPLYMQSVATQKLICGM